MAQQKNLQKLFSKPMDRKAFLAHIGAGFLVVIGVSGLLKNLVEFRSQPSKNVTDGYGSSPYGGKGK